MSSIWFVETVVYAGIRTQIIQIKLKTRVTILAAFLIFLRLSE